MTKIISHGEQLLDDFDATATNYAQTESAQDESTYENTRKLLPRFIKKVEKDQQ